jgi:pterin-4a-carbinolamine dehydratase
MNTTLKHLNREFIERSQRPMNFERFPISAKKNELPIVATNKWCVKDGFLVKTFKFRRLEDREIFVNELFKYEREVQHNAIIVIDHDIVSLSLTTKDIGKPTEIDKEYALFADALFKDVVYCPDGQTIKDKQEFSLDDV